MTFFVIYEELYISRVNGRRILSFRDFQVFGIRTDRKKLFRFQPLEKLCVLL